MYNVSSVFYMLDRVRGSDTCMDDVNDLVKKNELGIV